MGWIRLIDLFRALYLVSDVERWRECVEDVRAHFLKFISYLLD